MDFQQGISHLLPGVHPTNCEGRYYRLLPCWEKQTYMMEIWHNRFGRCSTPKTPTSQGTAVDEHSRQSMQSGKSLEAQISCNLQEQRRMNQSTLLSLPVDFFRLVRNVHEGHCPFDSQRHITPFSSLLNMAVSTNCATQKPKRSFALSNVRLKAYG